MTQKNIVRLMLAAAAFTLVAGLAQAQDLHSSRRPSPMAMARVTLDDGTYVRVVYSRPYLRGRDNIFGTEESEALVPFGKVWRTGANEATEITVTGDVMVGDKQLPAGTYSILSIPGAENWTVHFNSALGLNGVGRFADGKFTPIDVPATDVAVVEAKPSALGEDDEVDQFTISFEDVDGGAHMVLQWHNTEVRVPFTPAG